MFRGKLSPFYRTLRKKLSDAGGNALGYALVLVTFSRLTYEWKSAARCDPHDLIGSS